MAIDLNIQELAHNSLVSKLKEFKARFGTVIIMEVESGEYKSHGEPWKVKFKNLFRGLELCCLW